MTVATADQASPGREMSVITEGAESGIIKDKGLDNVIEGKDIDKANNQDTVTANAHGEVEKETAPQRIRLEEFKRCSDSLLWKLMMSFYDRKGALAWAHGIVPSFITSNAYITKAYARILHGFFADLYRGRGALSSQMKLRNDEKFYIVELGSGSGKFAFLMLKALTMIRDILDFPVENIVYVMTDFTESNLLFWKGHPSLQPFVELGQLDFALFDAVNDDELKLYNSGLILSRDQQAANPICVVANYLFDTLCHDIFRVEEGELKEGLISVGTSTETPDPLDPEIIQSLANEYCYRPIDIDYYERTEDEADHTHLTRILEWYRDKFTTDDPTNMNASILMPIGAIRSLRKLSDICNGRMLVISSDKGNSNPELFRGLVDPHIAVHGSFSVMVNYHALGCYFVSRGGFSLQCSQEEASLKVSCFVLPGMNDVKELGRLGPFAKEGFYQIDTQRASQFPLLRQAFLDHADSFGPNDFFVMQKCLKEESPRLSLRSLVSLLKLSNWDAEVFYKFRDTILTQLALAGPKLRNDLCQGVPLVWENNFMLDQEKDIAFEVGRFYYGVRRYEDALRYYRLSLDHIGPHHVTFHNMGLCYYSLGDITTAASYFKKSLEMNRSYEKALSWLEKVTKEVSS